MLREENEKLKKEIEAFKIERTRAQISALFYELGVLDHLLNIKVSQTKIAGLLSRIFKYSAANFEKDLSTRHNKNASFKNQEAYEKAIQLFKQSGMNDYERKAQTTLKQIETSKE